MGDTTFSSQAAKGTEAKNTSFPKDQPVNTGKRIIFTGPNGTGNYRSNLADYTFFIGSRTLPKEGTSEALYLWRPAPMNQPPWLRKNEVVGEIGWGVREYGPFLRSSFPRRKDMKREVFPPAEEHEIINRYMNPRWNIQPAPDPQHLEWAGYCSNDLAGLANDSMDSSSHRMKVCGPSSKVPDHHRGHMAPIDNSCFSANLNDVNQTSAIRLPTRENRQHFSGTNCEESLKKGEMTLKSL